ncbi:uncharacterized transporter YutK-like isoform X1 [Diabrotica undecimpunctata]|uniref:uncharacterized transporter YutK-like isoform X1 n=1 Tax=Diabrotica undecimpunctata TaxID=50387 RepID=UPI003B637475
MEENSIRETEENKNSTRKRISNLFQPRKRILINLTVLIIFTIYFVWATYYYLQNNPPGWEYFGYTTCTGYGFLVIIYAFTIYGYLKFYLLRTSTYLLFKNDIFKSTFFKLNNAIDNHATSCVLLRHLKIVFYAAVIIAIGIYLALDTTDNRLRLIPLIGLVIFLIIGYLLSNNRSKVKWRTIFWGVILQFIFGLLTIRWNIGRNILECIGAKVDTLLNYAFKAAEFPYGEELVKNQQLFAFRSLSTVYFISFLVNILYYYGIMQNIVLAIGSLLKLIMGTSICESVNSAANIFLGMTEAPLILAPYLKDLTASEIHSVMTSGFATVAGSVLAAYISFGARPQDLITSSIMSAPAALCYSKLLYPETEVIRMKKKNIQQIKIEYNSVLEAATKGVASAMNLVHGIISGLIAFLAAVYFVNGVLGWIGELVGQTEPYWSLELITGKIFIPISYIMGVPWKECESVGTLIGIKTMVNEFVAFQRMGAMSKENLLSPRTKVIATYAICGFSNPASIGIMTSALNTLIPNKTDVITRVVMRAWFGGAIVCFMTACIAGIVMPDEAV